MATIRGFKSVVICKNHPDGVLQLLPKSPLIAICCARDFREYHQISSDEWGAFVRSLNFFGEYTDFPDDSVELLAEFVTDM